ncbi:MAG: serine/threonine protein kinase, partial [Clostridium sp.]|nr:serine/threonine protein kinase [Clostridium sp.]
MQGLKQGAMLRHDTYRIERTLGQGGFGITYLATDLSLDRLVAIKEFFPKDYCDREASTSHVTIGTQNSVDLVNRLKGKFLKEARNIAKLDHPGIIKIHAAFEENNTAYYVMDYIEGESLSEMVRRGGPLTESRAIGYIEKVGEALEYVHAQRINHLDIKPANIMVRRSDDTPILIDFGLSKQYDTEGNQTSTTPVGISHGYAPMEQYNDG